MIDPNDSGWIDHKEGVAEIEALKPQIIYGGTPDMRQSGAGKVQLLYSVYDSFPVIHQGSAPSCVACATAGALDCLRKTEIADGDREDFVNFSVEEFIYFVSRVIIGKNRLRGSGGSLVSWAVAGLEQIGFIVKDKYGNLDLTSYSAKRAVDWGDGRNIPGSELVQIAAGQKILDFVRIKSYEEARDAIYNKYPVIVGSQYGYSRQRDAEGFALQNTRWAHCYLPNSFIWGDEFKKIQDLSVGDGIYSHDGELTEVTEIKKQKYCGDIYNIRVSNGFHKVTSDHPFLVKYQYLRNRECIPYDGSVLDNVTSNVVTKSKTKLAWIKAKDLCQDDYLIMPKPKLPSQSFIPDNKELKITPNSDLAWFFGMYLGDGYSTKNHKIIFTQNINETNNINRLLRVAKKYFNLLGTVKNRKIKENCNAVNIIFYSAKLSNFMHKWFKTKNLKEIPQWLLSKEWDLRSLLMGFNDSDGCYLDNKWYRFCITNSSYKLIQQFNFIINYLGFKCWYREIAGGMTIFNNKKYQRKRQYALNVNLKKFNNSDFCYNNIKKIEKEFYSDEIITLETANHTYVVNGSLSHNCMWWSGVDDSGRRPGICNQNSWGRSYHYGPKRHNQPDGSFWIDADNADKMCRNGDAWAISNFKGFPLRADWRII